MPGWRAEPCNLNGICQSNNTCFCENDFATCAPLDTTNGCETNIGNDTNKRALPAARPVCEQWWQPASLSPWDTQVAWQHLVSVRYDKREVFPICAPGVSQPWPSLRASAILARERPWLAQVSLIRVGVQLRVLRIPVPHRQRRVLQRRVRGPADQLHQLRPVRLLLRQPAQHPGVCNLTIPFVPTAAEHPHLYMQTGQPESSWRAGLAELRQQACLKAGAV